MRIGIDATCVANGRGYGRFARELLGAMADRARDDEFVLFVDPRAAAACSIAGSNVRLVVVPQRVSPTLAAAAGGARAPDDMLRLSRAVWRSRVDVFFSPSVYTYFPLPPGLAAVVTLHDAIADRFPELTLPSRRARLFWRLKTGLALAQARLVLTVSRYAAGEIAAVYGVEPARIRVSGEAPAPVYRPSESAAEIAAAAARAGVPPGDRWFIYVGGFNPHKHVDAIVRAHARVVAVTGANGALRPPRLLLVGTRTGDVFHGAGSEIERAIAAHSTGALVHWLGFVPDAELRHLLSGALALLLPSRSEGFGLPAVEAAACGTPVVATTASPLPELLAGGGYFVPPGDVDALADAMWRLAGCEATRSALGRTARERAGELSWGSAAEVTLAALREAAA